QGGDFDDVDAVGHAQDDGANDAAVSESGDETEAQAKRRRRGRRRRGGRNRGEPGSGETGFENAPETGETTDEVTGQKQGEYAEAADVAQVVVTDEQAGDAPAPKKRTRRRKADAVADLASADLIDSASVTDTSTIEGAQDVGADAPVEKPPVQKTTRARRKKADSAEQDEVSIEVVPETGAEPAAAKRPRRKKADAAPVEQGSADDFPGEQPLTPRPAADMVSASRSDPVTGEAGGAAYSDAAGSGDAGSDDADGTPRRGWWQRTFGA
ncbi:MAG: hypothetical protein M3N34_02725, partial [Pseudomonadota bacterium]|nr:hypothetical protein [Pseudomonadota bacterium]